MSSETDLISKTSALKKDLGAVILAHNYQSPEVQDIADFVGDSLELSIKAMQSGSRVIVFAGVDFMAEQAAVLNENSVVLHPEPNARCPMASMVSVDDVERARRRYPRAPVVMYVNSPATVKAKADYIVTSANAVEVAKAIEAEQIIFGPDRHLADYIAEKTGKHVIPIPENGHCPVHTRFEFNTIKTLKSIYRDCVFIAHPECPRGIRSIADFVGSTSQMVKYVKSCKARCFLIGTEIGIIHRLMRERGDAVYIPASTSAICEDMKKITLEKIYYSLKHGVYRVSVDSSIAYRVRKAIENTFNVLGVEVPWK